MSYLVFNVGLLILVQVDLEKSATVQSDADSLADDFGRVDQVVKDGVVDCGQRTTTGSLLLQLVRFPEKINDKTYEHFYVKHQHSSN